jgi:pyruvate ferredoxin oxidoreductase gamma subunit
MFRVRFHGRGGQGIKTAGQILSRALFLEGYEVQDAPRYGAERRGAPIAAYVRAAKTPIHERGVIAHADLVVAADETLVTMPAAGVLQGLAPATVLLVRSDEGPEGWRARSNLPCVVLTQPASARTAADCAGAAARLLGVVSRVNLERALAAELGGLGAAVLQDNQARALAAYDAFGVHAGAVQEGMPVAGASAAPDWITLPLEDAETAAPDIRAPGSSALSQTGLWRALRPVIDEGLCRRCSWICGTYCPDSAIRVEADRRPVIDYEHCKGCMVCVEVCPPHAIRPVPERLPAT